MQEGRPQIADDAGTRHQYWSSYCQRCHPLPAVAYTAEGLRQRGCKSSQDIVICLFISWQVKGISDISEIAEFFISLFRSNIHVQ